jgi:two-component system, chemotaxis family, response regulator Rcp1
MKVVTVLVVEDNLPDVVLMREALQESHVATKVYVVPDVPRALAFLQGHEKYHNPVRPDVMVVDLHLPGKTGHELLAEVKSTPALADIPVVIFTSSLVEEDREISFALQAADYVLKPMDSEAYFANVQRIVECWGLSKSLQ